MVEVQRAGEWVTARVSRAPTDERPNDGSFRALGPLGHELVLAGSNSSNVVASFGGAR